MKARPSKSFPTILESDPSLPYNVGQRNPQNLLRIATFLGWLTRERRIQMGKKMTEFADAARDGGEHYFSRHQRPVKRTFVFLATSQAREDRVDFLRMLCLVRQASQPADAVFGVATEPLGPGRSYDFYLVEGDLSDSEREHALQYRHLWDE